MSDLPIILDKRRLMNHHFRYEQCDIPAGKTIVEHRRARAESVASPAPRRGLRRLWPGRRRPQAA